MTLAATGKTLAMETMLAIHSKTRYFDFLGGFVLKHAPWLYEASVATKRHPELWRRPFCGHGGLVEPQSMLKHKTAEEIEVSGL